MSGDTLLRIDAASCCSAAVNNCDHDLVIRESCLPSVNSYAAGKVSESLSYRMDSAACYAKYSVAFFCWCYCERAAPAAVSSLDLNSLIHVFSSPH